MLKNVQAYKKKKKTKTKNTKKRKRKMKVVATHVLLPNIFKND